MNRIPPPPPSPELSTSPPPTSDLGGEKHELSPDASNTKSEQKKPDVSKALANTFVNMDVRNLKWMWTGLTFGKSGSPKSTTPSTPGLVPPSVSDAVPEDAEDILGSTREEREIEVDTESLQDAITSENVHLPSARGSPAGNSPAPLSNSLTEDSPGLEPVSNTPLDEQAIESTPSTVSQDQNLTDHLVPQNSTPHQSESNTSVATFAAVQSGASEAESVARSSSPQEPPLVFSNTPVYLSEPGTPEQTCRQRVFRVTVSKIIISVLFFISICSQKGKRTFVFVGEENDDIDLIELAENVVRLLNEVQRVLRDAHERSAAIFNLMTVVADDCTRELEGSALTVTRILEPQDKHIVSAGSYASTSSAGFSTTAPNLFNAREILHRFALIIATYSLTHWSLYSGFDVLEVFSRGQNPQHWYIGRRGLNAGDNDAEVYMEVARKESTLSDVDNGLASVVSRFVT